MNAIENSGHETESEQEISVQEESDKEEEMLSDDSDKACFSNIYTGKGD